MRRDKKILIKGEKTCFRTFALRRIKLTNDILVFTRLEEERTWIPQEEHPTTLL